MLWFEPLDGAANHAHQPAMYPWPNFLVWAFNNRNEEKALRVTPDDFIFLRRDLDALTQAGCDDRQDPADKIRSDLKVNLLVLIWVLSEMVADKSGPGFRNCDGTLNRTTLHAAIKAYAADHAVKANILEYKRFTEYLTAVRDLIR